MKIICLIFFFTFSSHAICQDTTDYIINLNHDTDFVKILRIDKDKKNVLVELKGEKTKHEAKDIIGFKFDTIFYESALVKIKRSKEYFFLNKTVKGRLCLYEIDFKTKIILWKNIGEDFIRFRWVYRAQKWAKKEMQTVYFYKKENEPKEEFSKSWKEKVKKCTVLNDKINSKSKAWEPSPKELVQFYNSNCP